MVPTDLSAAVLRVQPVSVAGMADTMSRHLAAAVRVTGDKQTNRRTQGHRHHVEPTLKILRRGGA